jgi:adenylate cyclase
MSKQRRRNKWFQGTLITVVCSAVIIALWFTGALETLEFKTFDARLRRQPTWDPSQGTPATIAMVLIDQTSLENVSRVIHHGWPWPREFYAKIIGYLYRAGARAVVFDMYFSEPDSDRPELSGKDSDAALVMATELTSNVVHSCLLYTQGEPAPADETKAIKQAASFDGNPQWIPAIRTYRTGAFPSAALTEAAAAIGFATQVPENDNICRRQALLASVDNTIVKSQALAATAFLRPTDDIQLKPGRLMIGDDVISIDDAATSFLHWYRPPEGRTSPFDHYIAFNVLRDAIRQEVGMPLEIPVDAFKNRIVYIGSTATGLFDNWATPLSKTTPGVEIQATALANLLRGETITRVPAVFTVFLILIPAILMTVAAIWGRHHTSIVILVPVALLTAIILGSYAALRQADLFVDMVPPALVVFSTFLVATLTNYLSERRHSRMVRGIFEHYLDSSVVENLIADPDKVRLGGERRECTVLFTDVANFTTTSESLSPEQVVRFMNIYLNAMTDIIIQEGGFVDKFIGDEIVAVFGAPNPLPNHAACACRASLRMAEKVKALQPAFREAGCQTTIFARTGMCTGDVVIGNMGSESRMNYTAMGNTMNLGARIQGITKMYGAMIFTSRDTAQSAGDETFIFREVDAVRVKGKTQAEHIMELLGFRDTNSALVYRATDYEKALHAYRQRDWKTALNILEPLEQEMDGPAISLATRCRDLLKSPPDENWEPVTNMLTK